MCKLEQSGILLGRERDLHTLTEEAFRKSAQGRSDAAKGLARQSRPKVSARRRAPPVQTRRTRSRSNGSVDRRIEADSMVPTPDMIASSPAVTRPTVPSEPSSLSPASRLTSIDALRGFDMFWILGADAAMRALGRATRSEPFTTIAAQFEHKEWAGFAFYDLIFPLFIFIVGASAVFSLTRIVTPHGRTAAMKLVLLRRALLYLLGVFYNGGLTNPWPIIRLAGVLPRIALAYTATGLLFCFFKPRILAAITGLLLAGYWALLTFVPIRNFQLHK